MRAIKCISLTLYTHSTLKAKPMATNKKSSKQSRKKRPMTIEDMTPQPHEVPGNVALALLGFKSLASVRKLRNLGEIEGRLIGSDLWYDGNSIEAYNDRRRPRGRRPIEEGGKKRGKDDPLRAYNRLAKRVNREGGSLRDVEDKPRPWSKKAAKKAAKGRAASKGAKGRAASKSGRSSSKRARSAGKKK